MKAKIIQWVGILVVLEIGLIHLLHAQHEFEHAAVMGYLFVANFAGALLAAAAIYRKLAVGWLLGAAIALGSIAAYVWSRTLGLPGLEPEEWITPLGVISLVFEGGFALLCLMQPWKLEAAPPASKPAVSYRVILPMAGFILIAAIGVVFHQWDEAFSETYGHHVGSLREVSQIEAIPPFELKEKYGVQVALVATSMMNSIVDVRLKILDPEKAQAFLQNQGALLLDQNVLILAPHMHSHIGPRLKAGKIYSVFFPTQQEIHPGSQVSLVFGSIRTEQIPVQ
jgi:hypothetical protein